MKSPIDIVRGRIVDIDKHGIVTIKARYDDWPMLLKREYKECNIIECRPEQIHAHLVIDWLGDAHCSNCGEEVNCTEPFGQHCGARLDEPEVKEY